MNDTKDKHRCVFKSIDYINSQRNKWKKKYKSCKENHCTHVPSPLIVKSLVL